MKYILDKSPGAISEMHLDGDAVLFREKQNVDDLIESNLRRRNELNGYTDSRDLACVADIPMVVYEQLRRDGILEDKKRFMKWLDDPENRAFRTNNMKLTGTTHNRNIIVK